MVSRYGVARTVPSLAHGYGCTCLGCSTAGSMAVLDKTAPVRSGPFIANLLENAPPPRPSPRGGHIHAANAMFFSATYNVQRLHKDGSRAPLTCRSYAWGHISRDFNQFVHRLSRTLGYKRRLDVKTLRVLEPHKSGIPHVHAILMFPDYPIVYRRPPRSDKCYIDKPDYRGTLQPLWPHGYSDWKVPHSGHGSLRSLRYIMKYLDKGHAARIWARVLANRPDTDDGSTPEKRTEKKIDDGFDRPARVKATVPTSITGLPDTFRPRPLWSSHSGGFPFHLFVPRPPQRMASAYSVDLMKDGVVQ